MAEVKVSHRPFQWNPLNRAFCEHYVTVKQLKQAAIKAGYKEASASQKANELLKIPEIQEYIKFLQAELAESRKVSRERIAERLEQIAFADIRKFYKEDGTLKPIAELDDAEAAALSGFEVETLGENGAVIKIKRWDPVKALDSLVKLFGYDAPQKHVLVEDEKVAVIPYGQNVALARSEDEVLALPGGSARIDYSETIPHEEV